jgi:hypothetical protein
MENDREDAPQLAPASEELSGDVLTDTKRDEVVVTGNEARREPVVFLDHTGARYLFPFERCQTWSVCTCPITESNFHSLINLKDFKFLIREAYSQASEETRSEISKEEFDILTSGNETILPAVWEYVIGGLPLYKRGDYSYTVKIRFWVSNDIYDRPREGSSRHVNPVTARYRRHEGIRRVGSDVSCMCHPSSKWVVLILQIGMLQSTLIKMPEESDTCQVMGMNREKHAVRALGIPAPDQDRILQLLNTC